MESVVVERGLGFILEELQYAKNVEEPEDENEKVLTPLENPKTKMQLSYCETLTNRMKQDEEFILDQIESDLTLNEFEENMNMNFNGENACFIAPGSMTSIMSNNVESKNLGNNKPIVKNDNRHVQEKAELSRKNDFKKVNLPNANISNNTMKKIETKSSVEPINNNKNIGATHRKVLKRKLNPSKSKQLPQDYTKEEVNKPMKCLYTRGTIVWAKVVGYSFWPAMIDEDPDNNTYFWNSNASVTLPATHYHVVFFDSKDRLSRSWVKPRNLKPFNEVVIVSKNRPESYIARFKQSVKFAKEASSMSVEERLNKFSFKKRLTYPGIKLCQD